MQNPTLRWLPLLGVALCTWIAAAAWSSDRHHDDEESDNSKSGHHQHNGHDHHDHEPVQHGAHVHGQANAFVVLEGQRLSVVLESPAANIVGFEHRASTDEQRSLVLAAQETLEQGERVLKVHGGGCQLKSAETDVSQLLREDAETHSAPGHQHHHHHHHDYQDASKHTAKDQHQPMPKKQHGHKAEHSDKKRSGHGEHADIRVSYEFVCAQPERVEALEFAAFGAFSGLEKITAQWVSDLGQGASDLRVRNPILRMQ